MPCTGRTACSQTGKLADMRKELCCAASPPCLCRPLLCMPISASMSPLCPLSCKHRAPFLLMALCSRLAWWRFWSFISFCISSPVTSSWCVRSVFVFLVNSKNTIVNIKYSISDSFYSFLTMILIDSCNIFHYLENKCRYCFPLPSLVCLSFVISLKQWVTKMTFCKKKTVRNTGKYFSQVKWGSPGLLSYSIIYSWFSL